jgi:hypothetical protein
MRESDVSRLAAVVKQLQRDWPVLVADEHLGQRFLSLLEEEDLGEVLQDFLVPMQRDA